MTLKGCFYLALTFILILALVLMVQLHRYGTAVDVARFEALQSWAGDDPEKQRQMQNYFEHCISVHRNPDDSRRTEHIGSLYQCAEESGSEAIARQVREAPASVRVPAPLRWFW